MVSTIAVEVVRVDKDTLKLLKYSLHVWLGTHEAMLKQVERGYTDLHQPVLAIQEPIEYEVVLALFGLSTTPPTPRRWLCTDPNKNLGETFLVVGAARWLVPKFILS